LTLVEKAVEYAIELGGDYDAARDTLLGRLGTIYYQRGDFDRAIDYYEQVLELARQREDKPRQVQAMSTIGALMGTDGAQAESYLNAAYQLADELDDDYLRAFVLENQAFHAQSKGDYESTRTYSTRQISIAEGIGDITTQVFALNNLGTAEKILGNPDDALTHHRKMLDLARTEGNDIWIAYALQGIGEDYHALGNRDEAHKYLQEALELFREFGIQANVTEIEDFLRIEQYP
jgi:tetratricopeptide (TPR) repeat protein